MKLYGDIKIRKDTLDNLIVDNPRLEDGEPVSIIDLGLVITGDGESNFNTLFDVVAKKLRLLIG
jgi:hypothetical protein